MIRFAQMVAEGFIKPLIFESKIIAKDTSLLLKNIMEEIPLWCRICVILTIMFPSILMYSFPWLDTYVKMDFVGVVCIFYALFLVHIFLLSSLFTPTVSFNSTNLKECFGDTNLPKLEHLL